MSITPQRGGSPLRPILVTMGAVAVLAVVQAVRNDGLAGHPRLEHATAATLDALGLDDSASMALELAGGRLAVRAVGGLLADARWNGEPISAEQLHHSEGVLTVLDEQGRVRAVLGLTQDAEALADATSPWRRLGFWAERSADGRSAVVRDVAADGPAAAAGLRVGDSLASAGGGPAFGPGLRGALLGCLPGGPLTLVVQRDGAEHELRVDLPALLPAEALAGSHDWLGDWRAHARRERDANTKRPE